MAPFIINHPSLLHQWIFAKEDALRQIREINKVKESDLNIFKECLQLSKNMISTWETESEYQIKKIRELSNDIKKFESEYLSICSADREFLWNHLYKWIDKHLSFEGIEFIISLMMEPYDSIVNPLISKMSSDEDLYFNIPTNKKVSELDKFSIIGIEFEVIEIPGHTLDHIAFYSFKY